MRAKLLVTLFILVVLLTGCSEKINFETNKTFGVISTIKSDSIINGSPKFNEVYIFEDLESYKKYYEEFFESHGEIQPLNESDFEKKNIILYNTLLTRKGDGEAFKIEEIRIYGEKIKVYITSNTNIKSAKEVSSELYNYAHIAKVDKNLIPQNYEVVVVKK